MFLNTQGSVRIIFFIALVTVVALNIIALPLYPPPSCDEVSYSGVAVSLLEQGSLGWAAFTQGEYLGRDINVVHQGRLYTLGLALLFRTGGVSLITGRMYSIIGWIIASYLTYQVGATLYSPKIALTAALAFASSLKTFFVAHLIRPEIWTAVSILVAIWIVIVAIRDNRQWVAWLAGIIVVMPFDYHGYALAFVIGLTAAFLFETVWKQQSYTKAAVFILGGFCGGVMWIIGHAFPAPHIAWRQFFTFSLPYASFASVSPVSTTLNNIYSAIVAFLPAAYWTLGGPIALLEGMLVGIGVIIAAIRRNQSDRIMLIVIIVSFIIYASTFSQRFVSYSVMWSPLLLIVGIASLEKIIGLFPINSVKADHWFFTFSVILIFANIVGSMWLTLRYANNNFTQMGIEVRRTIPPEARVLADPDWWWNLRQTNTFIPDEYFLYPLPYENASTLNADGRITDYVAYFHPDYILMDSSIACVMDPGGPGWAELEKFAKSQCKVVGIIDGAWWGDTGKSTNIVGQRTTVYKCDSYNTFAKDDLKK